MGNSELLEKIKDTLQREEDIDYSMKLEDLEEWDSLAIIAIISLYDQLYSKVFSIDEIGNCNTVEDLVRLSQNDNDSL
jgi:acyl carrier protein